MTRRLIPSLDRVQLVDRFYLQDQSVVDQQVHAESCGKSHTLEFDIDRLLPIDLVSGTLKTAGKNGLVDAFEQAWSEFACILIAASITSPLTSSIGLITFSAPLRLCANPYNS